MQEASGADFTDRNWSAQPSSDDLAIHCAPHFPSTDLFVPSLQLLARHTVAAEQGIVTRGLASRAFVVRRRDVWPGSRRRQAARSFLLVDL